VSATVTVHEDIALGIWRLYASGRTPTASVSLNGINYTVSNVTVDISDRSVSVSITFDVGTSTVAVTTVSAAVTIGSFDLFRFTVNCSNTINVVGTTVLNIRQSVYP